MNVEMEYCVEARALKSSLRGEILAMKTTTQVFEDFRGSIGVASEDFPVDDLLDLSNAEFEDGYFVENEEEEEEEEKDFLSVSSSQDDENSNSNSNSNSNNFSGSAESEFTLASELAVPVIIIYIYISKKLNFFFFVACFLFFGVLLNFDFDFFLGVVGFYRMMIWQGLNGFLTLWTILYQSSLFYTQPGNKKPKQMHWTGLNRKPDRF